MNTFLRVVISVTMLGLVGCGEKDEPIFDVDYYKTNNQERITKLNWCEESAERKQLINCRNASSAKAQLSTQLLLGDGISRKQ